MRLISLCGGGATSSDTGISGQMTVFFPRTTTSLNPLCVNGQRRIGLGDRRATQSALLLVFGGNRNACHATIEVRLSVVAASEAEVSGRVLDERAEAVVAPVVLKIVNIYLCLDPYPSKAYRDALADHPALVAVVGRHVVIACLASEGACLLRGESEIAIVA